MANGYENDRYEEIIDNHESNQECDTSGTDTFDKYKDSDDTDYQPPRRSAKDK